MSVAVRRSVYAMAIADIEEMEWSKSKRPIMFICNGAPSSSSSATLSLCIVVVVGCALAKLAFSISQPVNTSWSWSIVTNSFVEQFRKRKETTHRKDQEKRLVSVISVSQSNDIFGFHCVRCAPSNWQVCFARLNLHLYRRWLLCETIHYALAPYLQWIIR